jgi:hypothetical protein
MDVCVYSVFMLGSGLATGWSLVQGVQPNVLDSETEVKRSVLRMPYAPRGSNKEWTNQPTIVDLMPAMFTERHGGFPVARFRNGT